MIMSTPPRLPRSVFELSSGNIQLPILTNGQPGLQHAVKLTFTEGTAAIQSLLLSCAAGAAVLLQ